MSTLKLRKSNGDQVKTDAPIIGILSQETYSVSNLFPDKQYDAFIAASYVKFLESAGARVIPVWIGQNRSYYERVVNYTNGILFPGGATYFNETEGFGDAAKIIYDIATQVNNKGSFYPLFGICLGMQVLMYAANNGVDIRVDCSAKKISLPLEFRDGFNNSVLFGEASEEIINILKTDNVTYNYHQFCLIEQDLDKAGLLKDWKILSTNKDIHNLEFVSSMEHTNYPFYGIEFHPEKIPFEFKVSLKYPHSINAKLASQYFGNFFIEKTKINGNSFPSQAMENSALIYNYSPFFTAPKNSSYQQLYMFTKEDFANNQLL